MRSVVSLTGGMGGEDELVRELGDGERKRGRVLEVDLRVVIFDYWNRFPDFIEEEIVAFDTAAFNFFFYFDSSWSCHFQLSETRTRTRAGR